MELEEWHKLQETEKMISESIQEKQQEKIVSAQNSYTKELKILGSMIKHLDQEVKVLIRQMDGNKDKDELEKQAIEKYQSLKYDIANIQKVYSSCASLFVQSNYESYKNTKKFTQATELKQAEQIQLQPQPAVEEPVERPKVPRTEIFENFELLEEKEEKEAGGKKTWEPTFQP